MTEVLGLPKLRPNLAESPPRQTQRLSWLNPYLSDGYLLVEECCGSKYRSRVNSHLMNRETLIAGNYLPEGAK